MTRRAPIGARNGTNTENAMTMTRRIPALAAVAALAVALAGCDAAPWAQQPATPTPTATSEPVVNDLEAGSVEREVHAGAVTAEVTYWSELPMEQWTAGASKPLSLSLSATVSPDDGQQVYLQRVSMTVTPDAGESPDEQQDTASEQPGYLVADPYSYSQAFMIGALPEDATSVEVRLRYEFLVQTTPTSDDYAKQTATDAMTIAIVR